MWQIQTVETFPDKQLFQSLNFLFKYQEIFKVMKMNTNIFYFYS